MLHSEPSGFHCRCNSLIPRRPLELAGEQTEKKPVKDMDWDTETLVEGKELESGKPIRRDSKMLVTGEFTDLPLWQY